MTHEEDQRIVDTLTSFFLPEAANSVIRKYIEHNNGCGKDTVFLIHLNSWQEWRVAYGDKNADLSLAKFSFLLTKLFHNTDMFVRVGPDVFFIYAIGYYQRSDIQRNVNMLMNATKEFDSLAFDFHIGVCHVEEESSFAQLLEKAEGSLVAAEESNQLFVMDHAPAEYPQYPQTIPYYELDSHDVDMKYLGDMINFLFGGMDPDLGIEMVLSRMCDYFHVQQVYIMERDFDGDGYSISHNWLCEEEAIENDNFKKLPTYIGNQYQSCFDRQQLIVCNQLSDLYKYNKFIALREKISGTKSLVQGVLMENGDYVGYLTMLDRKKERVWTPSELATFSMLTRILNTSILQRRSKVYHRFVIDCDVLTNSWNLKKFTEKVTPRLQEAKAKAIITMDIKNFKFINSEYGYAYGNRLLISIAEILSLFIDERECYARMDGDTFVLLLYYHNLDILKQRILSLIHRVERCTISYEREASIVCMLGVYLQEGSVKNIAEMIDCANTARKSIKSSHNSSFAFFNEEIEEQNIREHHLTQIMKQSLRDEKFVVYYQPKIDIHTRLCTGLEALVRWQIHETELLPPGGFIPLFERNRFIIDLDLYVLRKACMQIREWMDEGKKPFSIAVNISRVHLEDPGIIQSVDQICAEYEIPRHLIELEITESALLENEEMLIAKAMELKRLGFLISMDDFGTGFSSLNLLKDLPVDILKLDRAFFQKKIVEREKIILANIVHMAHELNVTVISEGIETKEQVQLLKDIGCDIAQGFYYSRPYPMDQLKDTLWDIFEGEQF